MFTIKIDIILKVFFLKLKNINILFIEEKLIQKFYITNKTLFIIHQIQIIYIKKFLFIILNVNNKIFIIYAIF